MTTLLHPDIPYCSQGSLWPSPHHLTSMGSWSLSTPEALCLYFHLAEDFHYVPPAHSRLCIQKQGHLHLGESWVDLAALQWNGSWKTGAGTVLLDTAVPCSAATPRGGGSLTHGVSHFLPNILITVSHSPSFLLLERHSHHNRLFHNHLPSAQILQVMFHFSLL